MYDTIRQREVCTGIPIVESLYGYSGADTPASPMVFSGMVIKNTVPQSISSGMFIGSKKVSLFNKTKDYRPNVFKINPFDLRVYEATHNSCEIITYQRFATSGRILPRSKITGPVGMLFCKPNVAVSLPVTRNTSVENRAIIGAENKIIAPIADIGVSLGEITETLSMIASPLSGVVKLARKLKRPKTYSRPLSKLPGTAMKYATDKWMEYRYGILPLIGEIEGYKDLYNAKLDYDGRIRKSVRKVRILPDEIGPLTSSFNSDLIELQLKGSMQYKVESFSVASIYFQVLNPYAMVANKIGLSVFGLPQLAWELTPFSWAVDWFTGFGTWLGAMRPKPELEILGYTYGTMYVVSYEWSANMASYWNFNRWSPCDARMSTKRRLYERSAIYGNTRFQLPEINFGFSNWKHVVDSLSVTWQKMPKFK